MKFPVAYYFVLIYLTVMLKPLLPLVSDAWDHAFAEARHIAMVHAKYGANHVEKEIAAESKDDASKTPGNSKISEPVPVHLPEKELTTHLTVPISKLSYPNAISVIPPAVILSMITPPPDCRQ